MKTNIIEVKDKKTLNALYKGSALTIEGLCPASIGDFLDAVDEISGLKERRAYVISGATMNAKYKLIGSNAYPEDLTIVCISLNDMKNPAPMAMARFRFDGRWFDDVVDNNARRESA